MNQDLRLYTWVRRTREVLFDYTQHLPLEIYTLERPDFGFGSIRNLHAHVADCYLWWVGRVGLGQAGLELDPRLIPDTAAMRGLFAQVYPFHHPSPPSNPMQISQRWLLHPITHEFNHKGQMLALGRVLGHPNTALDTDRVPPG